MFDGHLKKRVIDMTDAERLDWAWESAQLLAWARRAKTIHRPVDDDTPDENRRTE